MSRSGKSNKRNLISRIRWLLVLYDLIIWLFISFLFVWLHPSQSEAISALTMALIMAVGCACLFFFRFLLGVYSQVWRYGGTTAYLRLIAADAAGGLLFSLLIWSPLIEGVRLILAASIISMNLLSCITVRMLYFVIYKKASEKTVIGRICSFLLRAVGRIHVKIDSDENINKNSSKLPAAIIGAGRVGTALAQELLGNPNSGYTPVMFIETDRMKVGRNIYNIPIVYETEDILDSLREKDVQAVILALPEASVETKKHIYEYFKDSRVRFLTYDYPLAQTTNGERHVRQFSIEELLARKPVRLEDKRVVDYYRGKVVMITGGGGSIGSELCRQVITLRPKEVVILDIAENSTYELQMDLKMRYGADLNLSVEICDVTDKNSLERVYAHYRPDIVLHAAAHKHVPLMEHNSVECVRNNVFGTLNAVELAKKYGCEHFIMVSTDKAVNPTNIMGASKRMCELIVEDASKDTESGTIFTSTRFGNVLGSAGSVVPLFRRQIDEGGPVTITHKDIIRYFMTIPEASQLVLTSGALASNGELFVLDMGKPVKIYDMAENMIRLSGLTPGVDIEIVETGLRPGEKLYEELLIDPEKQKKTENELIFIEHDEGISHGELTAGLYALQRAVDAGDDEHIKAVMADTVKTYRRRDAQA